MTKTRPRKPTRLERSESTRAQLIESAAHVVGEFGYEGASISRICTRVGIAQGTFYNYFESRQELLELLPVYYGESMLQYLRDNIPPTLQGLDREVARLSVFIDFFEQHKVSERIISEAPVMAADGYRRFYKLVREGYRRALERDVASGAIRRMGEEELFVLVDMLIAIRNGLSQQILPGEIKGENERKTILSVYRDILGRAIFVSGDDPKRGAARRK
jgi:AcrR family transcriptional regulator